MKKLFFTLISIITAVTTSCYVQSMELSCSQEDPKGMHIRGGVLRTNGYWSKVAHSVASVKQRGFLTKKLIKTIDDSHTPAAEKEKRVSDLIKKGASVNVQCRYGVTPLFEVCHSQYSDVLFDRVLKRSTKETINAQTDGGSTPLAYAIRQKENGRVLALLQKGAHVNIANIAGETPLYVAAQNGCEQMVQALVEARASVNVKNKDDETLLSILIQQNGKKLQVTKIAETLVVNGAIDTINEKDKTWQSTPLYLAVYNGNHELVKYLLEHNAHLSINHITDHYGRITPLERASNPEMRQLVVEYGANQIASPSQQDKDFFLSKTRGLVKKQAQQRVKEFYAQQDELSQQIQPLIPVDPLVQIIVIAPLTKLCMFDAMFQQSHQKN